MPGNLDLGRINAHPPLDSGGCAQIVWRHGDLLATAREARLAAEARQQAATAAPASAAASDRRWRLRLWLPFLRAAR